MTEVDWPPAFDRTPPDERTKNRSYEVSLAKAFDDLEAEMERLDADDFRYSFDAPQREKDSRPYGRASPDDPSFVLRWLMAGEQFAVACDRYSRLRDNVRTVGHYVREKRKMESRPVATGESEFANARLPPGDDERKQVVVAGAGSEPPHEVLGVSPDAPAAVVKGAARSLKAEHHPDAGGDKERFKKVVSAEKEMLEDQA